MTYQEYEGSEPSKSIATVSGANNASSGQFVGRHFLSKQELALLYRVSLRTVDNWMAQHKIPFIRLSARLIRFNLERVKAALARYEIKEVGAPR
jgi:excisionase family DNA binding protein